MNLILLAASIAYLGLPVNTMAAALVRLCNSSLQELQLLLSSFANTTTAFRSRTCLSPSRKTRILSRMILPLVLGTTPPILDIPTFNLLNRSRGILLILAFLLILEVLTVIPVILTLLRVILLTLEFLIPTQETLLNQGFPLLPESLASILITPALI